MNNRKGVRFYVGTGTACEGRAHMLENQPAA